MEFFNEIKLLENEVSAHLVDIKENDFLTKFPEIAFQCLSKAKITFSLDKFYNEVLKQYQTTNEVHHYDINQTRNIHYTVVRNKKFFIDVYSWFDHTEIHDHNFCGAFRQLYGQSQQMLFQFEMNSMFDENIDLGKIKLISNNKVSEGQTFKIELKEKFIHQVMHLSKPTITICIRTPDQLKLNYHTYFFKNMRVKKFDLEKNETLWYKGVYQAYIVKYNSEQVANDLLMRFRNIGLLNLYLRSYAEENGFAEFLRKRISIILKSKNSQLLEYIEEYREYLIKTSALYSD